MSITPAPPAVAELRSRIAELLPRDERRLHRRLEGTRRIRDEVARAAALTEIAAEVEQAQLRLTARLAALPPISYPASLPVSQRKDDIAAAIRDHQVVVVAGETGSGKTTQIPKICLELGRGLRGQIGHTQPRRIAARTVAERIAEELDRPLGTTVGYKVRFTDQSGDDTMIKVMTDGILLAEMQNDRMLRRYDTLIIDEAHERSLNIDFILGYLRELLPRRPDLKVIITSATIETQRFAEHFAGPQGSRPGDRGVRPDLPGRGPLPPAGHRHLVVLRPRRGTPGRADRPGRRDRRRGRRAGPGERRRHPGLHVRRAGDPRHRRHAGQTQSAQHRDRAALRAACPAPSSTRSSSGTPAAASCWRPTSPRPR